MLVIPVKSKPTFPNTYTHDAVPVRHLNSTVSDLRSADTDLYSLSPRPHFLPLPSILFALKSPNPHDLETFGDLLLLLSVIGIGVFKSVVESLVLLKIKRHVLRPGSEL
ncbi:hypothetical protein PanWU01x14_189290 [Parasponia andersonii]|uniref:Uncharacterized protein n=1 Tax=Parasponia andersonii TaxID=3476 RepID=A0A2P5C2E7_PARAD|nr:hypothetical protein PanWU01x14_189290 [Parasponia andersonii]